MDVNEELKLLGWRGRGWFVAGLGVEDGVGYGDGGRGRDNI